MDRFPLGGDDLRQTPVAGRGDDERRLLRFHLEQVVALGNLCADLPQPLDDADVVDLAQIGKPEFASPLLHDRSDREV